MNKIKEEKYDRTLDENRICFLRFTKQTHYIIGLSHKLKQINRYLNSIYPVLIDKIKLQSDSPMTSIRSQGQRSHEIRTNKQDNGLLAYV